MTVKPGENVSARDMRLMAMLARGHTTDRAARELRLSRHTVGEEISALLERFNCRNRAQLVAYCYVHRLLPIGIWPPPYGPADREHQIDLIRQRTDGADAATEAALRPLDVQTLSAAPRHYLRGE